MAAYTNLPVFKAVYDLLLRLYEMSQHWRRDVRFSVGESMKTELLAISRRIYQANLGDDKLEHIRQARVTLASVRLQMRLVHDLHVLSLKQYSAVAEITDSISKQLAAWEKSERRKAQLAEGT